MTTCEWTGLTIGPQQYAAYAPNGLPYVTIKSGGARECGQPAEHGTPAAALADVMEHVKRYVESQQGADTVSWRRRPEASKANAAGTKWYGSARLVAYRAEKDE